MFHVINVIISERLFILKVVSVGGSESSSSGGSRGSGSSGDKDGAGGQKASPRYDGAMTITASGRLLDRINRLRRDCIKALGFNVLAQVSGKNP